MLFGFSCAINRFLFSTKRDEGKAAYFIALKGFKVKVSKFEK
jgi:hypothetical protein